MRPLSKIFGLIILQTPIVSLHALNAFWQHEHLLIPQNGLKEVVGDQDDKNECNHMEYPYILLSPIHYEDVCEIGVKEE